MENIIEVIDLERSYKTDAIDKGEKARIFEVLKGINFSVKPGEFVAIMGKSGCGKTTLLKSLGMVDNPNKGKILFEGEDTKTLSGNVLAYIRRNKIGFIFQDYNLMDSISVRENIILPMILNNEEGDKMMEKCDYYAKLFNIEKLLDKNPYQLSGGEKQRVAISRAIINDPDLILADEPTGNLDSKSSKVVMEIIKEINEKFKKTIIMVTHDPSIASQCSRVIFLKDGSIHGECKKDESQEELYNQVLEKLAEL